MNYKVTITQHGKYTESIEGVSHDFEDIVSLANLTMKMFGNVDIDINISNNDTETKKEDE